MHLLQNSLSITTERERCTLALFTVAHREGEKVSGSGRVLNLGSPEGLGLG